MKNYFHVIKIAMVSLITVLAFERSSYAQECTSYVPVKPGAEMEITHYTAADKVVSTTQMKILSKTPAAGGFTVKAHVKGSGENGKAIVDKDVNFKCVNGNFIWDINEVLGGQIMDMGDEYSVKMSGTDYKFPSKLLVGQTLENSETNVSIESQGVAVMSVVMTFKNRKVAAKEKVTTPAGTFDCFKITYDLEMKTMMNITIHGIDWIAEGVGMVKTQQFDQNNKLDSYSLLTRFKE